MTDVFTRAKAALDKYGDDLPAEVVEILTFIVNVQATDDRTAGAIVDYIRTADSWKEYRHVADLLEVQIFEKNMALKQLQFWQMKGPQTVN